MDPELFDPEELRRGQLGALAEIGGRQKLPIEEQVPNQPTNVDQPFKPVIVPQQPSDVPDYDRSVAGLVANGVTDASGDPEYADFESAIKSSMQRAPLRILQKQNPPSTAAVSSAPAENADDSDIGGTLLYALGRGLTAFGGGDVGALDKMRADKRNEPFRRRQQQAELQNIEEGVAAKQIANQKVMDATNPNSDFSKQRQKEHAETMRATASVLRGLPQFQSLADLYEAEAASAPSRSAIQLDTAAERLGKVLGQNRQLIDSMAQQELAKQGQAMRERGVTAQENNAKATQDIARGNLYVARGNLEERVRSNKENEEIRKEALRKHELGIQIKNKAKALDAKARTSLQDLDTMQGMLQEAEAALPKAMQGPLAKPIAKANDFISGATGGAIPMADSSKATLDLSSNIENAVADLRLQRFGSSLTSGERKALEEWSPDANFSQQRNQILIGAIRKYMGYRAQNKLKGLYQDIGMPIHMPTGTHVSLGDALALKTELEGLDKYNDEDAAGMQDRINKILAPYGGYVGHLRSDADQPTKGAPPAAKPDTGSKTGPYGDRVQRKGRWYKWDASTGKYNPE